MRSEAAAERDAALAAASSALMGEAEPGASPAVEGACKRTFRLYHIVLSRGYFRMCLLGRFMLLIKPELSSDSKPVSYRLKSGTQRRQCKDLEVFFGFCRQFYNVLVLCSGGCCLCQGSFQLKINLRLIDVTWSWPLLLVLDVLLLLLPFMGVARCRQW